MKSTDPDDVAVDNDPNNKSSRTVAGSAWLLSEHPALIAMILSYAIATPEDYARLRRVSPRWNTTLLPRALKAARNLCNSSRARGKNPFVQELAGWDENCWAGKRYDARNDRELFSFFEENVGIESMLFVQDDYSSDKRVTIAKEEGYPGVAKDISDAFSKLCQTLTESSSWEEFQTTATQACREGMFLSVEDFEQFKKEGAEFEFDDQWAMPVVLTATLPLKGARIVENTSFGRKVLLTAHIDRSNDEQIFVKILDKTMESDDEKFVSTFVGYNVTDNDDGESITCQIPMTVIVDDHDLYDDDALSYLPLRCLWSKCQEQTIREGVAFCDGIVPPDLHKSLVAQIDRFSDQQILDYHPHSKNIVRDIVHPALYSYVKGVSPLVRSTEEVLPETFGDESNDDSDTDTKDYWGREYEASVKYQWLPTYFDIGDNGNCTICDYINNLVPRSEHQELYTSLERLFSQALPLLESVYSYCRVVKNHHLRMDEEESMRKNRWTIQESPVSLRGRRLQVVTKIVDYELAPGQTYKGVWHVEGMSHEEIVATAIYFCDRDPEIVGGDILFKRAFHRNEATYISENIAQCRPREVETVIWDGLIPLGTVETRPGRFLVFPNSHVHKVTRLENKRTPPCNPETAAKRCSAVKKRRIIVFFLINPEKRIVSTREVPMQQEHVAGSMKRTDALDHRLELMKERKYQKQDWNVREIELCEH